MPSATSTPQPQSTHPTSHHDIPTFPPPSTFSLLPDLYLLISRLTPLLNNPDPSSTTNTLDATPLEIKDLPSAVYPIKQKIAKAKAAVQSLPDIGRSIWEQEVEIGQLERRCEALRGRLRDLGNIAAEGLERGRGGEDEVMEGLEEKGGNET